MRSALVGTLLASAGLLTMTACGAVQQPPSTTSTASASPTSTADWVQFSWPAAGFAAKVPSKPTKSVTTREALGVAVTFHLATIQSADTSIELGLSTFNVAVPTKDVGTGLHNSIETFAGLTHSTLSSIQVIRFHGFPARRVQMTSYGTASTFMIFQRDATHSIFIYAPEGSVYQEIVKSFRLL